MGRIGIIRHGETDWNKLTKLQGREDVNLNDTGLEQARMVGEYLREYDWDIILSSPLKRAKKYSNSYCKCTWNRLYKYCT